MLVIKNARLIPELTEGYSEKTGDIIIKEDKIVEILPTGTAKAEEGAKIIDAKGKTVMPGIMDLHMHAEMLLTFENEDPRLKSLTKSVLDSYFHVKDYLKQGYTFLREVGNSNDIGLNLRDLINSGTYVGPRMLSSAEILSPTAPGNSYFGELYQIGDSPDELRKQARNQIERGVDVLKYMATGAMLNKGGLPGARVCTVKELEALQEVAELAGIPTAVHCHGTEAIERCVEVGINTIEHASLINEKTIKMLVDNGEKSYLVPTMAIGYTMLGGPSSKRKGELTGVAANISPDKIYVNDQSHACIKNAYKAGLTLGFGTDIPYDSFMKTPGLEFIARKECCDMENIDMLIQATINSAKIIGWDDRLGTLKAGKLADIIIVDGNPDEDHMVMAKPMINVIVGGEVVLENGEFTK